MADYAEIGTISAHQRPLKVWIYPNVSFFAPNLEKKWGLLPPPSVEGQSARISGRVSVFGAEENQANLRALRWVTRGSPALAR